MGLALFDLDNTLLAGDSDYLWGCYLADIGVVDKAEYTRRNQEFYRQYQAGNLDIEAYTHFALHPLANNSIADLERWRAAFVDRYIRPIVLPRAIELLNRHDQNGDIRVIITSTNRFITQPIAALLGIEHLIASQPAFEAGSFTGKLAGPPCFQAGKLTCLDAWLAQHGVEAHPSWFYSDSVNDLPLLERVDHPVAVDPDEQLARHAGHQGWRRISLR